MLKRKTLISVSTIRRWIKKSVLDQLTLILLASLVGVVVLVTVFFSYYPELSVMTRIKQTILARDKAMVLGVQSDDTKDQPLTAFLKPISSIVSEIIKRLNLEINNKINPLPAIKDINQVFSVDEHGNMIPKTNIVLPDISYLKVKGGDGVQLQTLFKEIITYQQEAAARLLIGC